MLISSLVKGTLLVEAIQHYNIPRVHFEELQLQLVYRLHHLIRVLDY